MTTSRIEKTSIWKNTLATRKNDEFKEERDTLRTTFLKFRENTSALVNQISSVLPGLTLHDISHLDALWETASLIVGENFELTPLEGFVLGGAILLHDSALCFEAYENGKEGVRNTTQWKDAFADINETSPDLSPERMEYIADFAALRNLHAYQAEELLSKKWKANDSNHSMFLLEDQNIRNHLGKLIGQIASSHHWDIEKVLSTFNSQVNVPTGYPREWRIDPVKIACILRCADAIHIDNERAPDFLHALLKRSGVSFDHWKAQNKLAKVDLDQKDNSRQTLLITSTIDFKEVDANAWYVAYDAVCLADKEIKSCNSVLEKLGNSVFKIKKIKGAESPEEMAKYIKTDGWEPRSAKVHVGNVEKIIHNLGGEMLYGANSNQLGIVLCELIQNARDSIKARKVFDNDFEGKITISLTKNADSMWITVEDNGIGMSERVLTGPLLDFGTSFWTSSLVQSEFPGLRSSQFKSIGKFGIGFYSIFMVSEQVFVSSRNYNTGINDICQLKFTNGFSLRPILCKGAPLEFGSSISTQIKLKLKPDTINDDLLIRVGEDLGLRDSDESVFMVPFNAYLSRISAGLDAQVYYNEFDKVSIKVHESLDSPNFNKLEWLTQVSFAEYVPNSSKIRDYIANNIERLQFIIEDGNILGLAAINTFENFDSHNFMSIQTVGGLTSRINLVYGEAYIGFIDHTPDSARRYPLIFKASNAAIKLWAEDQLANLLKLNLSNEAKYIASCNLCYFNIDTIDLASVLINNNGTYMYKSIEELAELSVDIGVAFITSKIYSRVSIDTFNDIKELTGYALVLSYMGGFFSSLENHPFSLFSLLCRTIKEKGYTLIKKEIPSYGKNSVNWNLDIIILSAEKQTN